MSKGILQKLLDASAKIHARETCSHGVLLYAGDDRCVDCDIILAKDRLKHHKNEVETYQATLDCLLLEKAEPTE